MPDIIAALVTDAARLALMLEKPRPWPISPGCSIAPLVFPHMAAPPDAGRVAALDLAARLLDRPVSPVVSGWTYGPSARHAMDRTPADGADAPFLRYERFDTPKTLTDSPQRTEVRVYLAHVLGGGSAAPVVWVPPSVLRAALGGLWLAALLALEGVTLSDAAFISTFDVENTFIYTPANVGERQVLRACAKYGDQILFPLA
jgi:hypothetical protein